MTTIIQASVGTSNMQIEGTTALVTGANRGIGRAIAEALLDAAPRRSTPACATPRPSARRTVA
jgi:NAD(P)-dependent dehydrogenase (short-subunit alcohol dehydrogenase family)